MNNGPNTYRAVLQNTHLHQKLNFYVIARAMEFLELQDLVGAMGACRCLHYLGLPILLREMQLLFHDAEKSAVRFELYRWHLLKNPIRFSWVSSLCCSGDALYPGESEATARSSLSKPGYNLVDFMPYLTRLRVLDIEMHEQLLSPLVSQWIISLQGLRRLTLRHVANEVQPILDLMAQLGHKELDAIAISMSQSTQSVAVGPAFDPISTLSSFANSLKSLSIDWSDCRQAAVIPADMQHTYPAVQELYWNTPQCIHVGALIRAFPGARNLRVGERALDRVMPPLYSGAISERVMLAQRQRNFSAQNDPGMRWASLESLHGDPLVLWILAIRCRVARLETDLRSYRSTMGHLLSALHDTTPAHLVLSLSAKDVVNLDRVFNVPSLRTLKLTVDVHDEIHVLALLVRLFALYCTH